MAQPGLGVNTVELGRADQRVDRGGTLAAAVGTGEQVVAPTDGDTAQRPLGGRVVDLDDALVAVTQQRRPQLNRGQDPATVSDFRDNVSRVVRSQCSSSSSKGPHVLAEPALVRLEACHGARLRSRTVQQYVAGLRWSAPSVAPHSDRRTYVGRAPSRHRQPSGQDQRSGNDRTDAATTRWYRMATRDDIVNVAGVVETRPILNRVDDFLP